MKSTFGKKIKIRTNLSKAVSEQFKSTRTNENEFRIDIICLSSKRMKLP